MKRIILVGGGKLVYFLTRLFVSKGYAVTIVNDTREEAGELARQARATVVFGDGSDPGVLQEAEASTAAVVLAVTPHDQANLMICQIASVRFQVPRVLALVNDPDNEEVFRALGVSAFSPTKIIASLIEQRTEFTEITNLIPVGEGKITVTEILLSEQSPVSGKPLREIELPENVYQFFSNFSQFIGKSIEEFLGAEVQRLVSPVLDSWPCEYSDREDLKNHYKLDAKL